MKNTIICIGREYGSGGREIGEKLAKSLGIPYYDKLLLQEVAQEHGLSLSAVEREDEKPIDFSSIVSGNIFADSASISTAFYSQQQLVYDAQQKTLLEIAKKGSCVIIGRCASSVLRTAGAHVLSVFIYADEEEKIPRIAKRNDITEKAAARRMQKMDKMRRKFFDFYSDTPWGAPASYDLMLSSSYYGVDGAVEMIKNALLLEEKRHLPNE